MTPTHSSRYHEQLLALIVVHTRIATKYNEGHYTIIKIAPFGINK